MLYPSFAGIAHHVHICNLQVSVLFVLVRYAAVFDGFLGVFLHVVHFCVGNHSRRVGWGTLLLRLRGWELNR